MGILRRCENKRGAIDLASGIGPRHLAHVLDAATGREIRLEPLVSRVLAPNPSAFTGQGTQTHLVGRADVAIIDPGPEDAAHVAAVVAAVAGRPVRAILVTHHHRDHSPAAATLAAITGAPIVGAAPFARPREDGSPDPAFDPGYAPSRVLAEGDVVTGEGWTLAALATPGHTSRHLAFALPEAQDGAGALFSGDHVMGWSTSIVSPPDGDMGEYVASLEKVLRRGERIYYPGHGEAVTNPHRLVRGMIGHRRQREGQIRRRLAEAPATVASLAERMYAGLDRRLLPAAERSVLAHLIDLERRGLVRREEAAWTGTAGGS